MSKSYNQSKIPPPDPVDLAIHAAGVGVLAVFTLILFVMGFVFLNRQGKPVVHPSAPTVVPVAPVVAGAGADQAGYAIPTVSLYAESDSYLMHVETLVVKGNDSKHWAGDAHGVGWVKAVQAGHGDVVQMAVSANDPNHEAHCTISVEGIVWQTASASYGSAAVCGGRLP